MSLITTAKDELLKHTVAMCVAAFTALLGWVVALLGPYIAPAIAKVPPVAFAPVLLLSLLVNAILALLLYSATRKPKSEYRLKYGIYWDKEKNPHCPVCKVPVVYGEYVGHGRVYYCTSCKKFHRLADANGKGIEPAQVLAEL